MATNTERIVVQVVVQGQKDLANLEKRTGSTTKSFGRMAAGVLAAAAAFRTINQIVSNSVKSFRDFEFQMAKVRAITGAGRKEFLALEKSAKELGRSTFFTAQQVAELQTNYGKLGFTTKEILAAQEATLNLATATDSDLARAAIVAGSAVRGFGLDASETQRVTDVMAKAFTSSALDLEKFQTSMTKVAPIAKSAGFSIEDTTAIMAQLADSGIEASIAGTSLRNILLKMQDPNSDLVKSFGKTIHSLDQLVPALTKFSQEGGSLAEIMEVVDLRQAAAFEQMITSRDRTVALRDALEGANGAAADMAHIVGDSLEGAMKRLTSAFEGFQIAFIEHFGEGMKQLADGFAGFFNTITDFIEIPVSQKLEEDRIEMNLLFDTLKNTNISQDTRNRLITELNTKYSEYLPKLVTEKDNLEDLETAQLGANDALKQRILLQATQEQLQDVINKLLENQIEATRLAKLETELKNEVEEASVGSTERAMRSREGFDRRLNSATLKLQANTKAQENNKEEAEELKKEYDLVKEAAKNLGLTLDDTTTKIKTRTDATKQGTKATEEDTKATNENKKAKQEDKASAELLAYRLQLQEAGLLSKQQELDLQKELNNLRIQELENILNNTEASALMSGQRKAMIMELHNLTMSTGKTERELKDEQLARDLRAAALSGQTAKQAMISAIRAELMEAVAGYASSAFKTLPWPINIGVAAGAAAVVGGMFEKLVGGAESKFAQGGMVHGRSHAQGGEKFAVGGRVVELEGGEAVINKRSTAMFRNQLSAINAAGGGVKFADGGLLNMPSFSQQQFNALNQNQMMGAMSSGAGGVVVVEADITDSQNTVNVIEAQATV
jgi:TP901 family phage tail tape measure protein|tara:strand:+ start:61 stop:2592 length:2532 start_codon:yes stop_codon:yes gene_type:complete